MQTLIVVIILGLIVCASIAIADLLFDVSNVDSFDDREW